MSGQTGATSDAITVSDVPERSRYEAHIAGREDIGVAQYRLQGSTITFTHTSVPEALEGHGVGATLARYALDDARRRGLSVLPQCPFIGTFIRRHREYLTLVPAESRAEFGLPM
jgi:uncharacterized protein